MADIIGVLGESTVATIATTTVYTCPSGKAAKVKLMWLGLAGGDSLGDLTITVNGIAVATFLNMTTVEYFHSTSTLLIQDASLTSKPTGVTALLTVSPAPFEYYLSAGDIISYTIATTAMGSMNFQVVGTEIDVT
jgi:hypothetical protein